MNKKNNSIRHIVQFIFFLIIFFLIMSDYSVHAICPFGGIVTIHKYITTGTFIQKIHESAFVLMIIGFGIAILFGGVFCGWICPFGTFQEFLGKNGKKIFKKRYNNFIPFKFDRVLRYTRYIVLIWVLYVTITTTKLFFNDYDPYSALFHLFSDELALGGLIILFLVLILSLFIERPWCKYACPYGALLGIFNTFSIFKIHRNNKTCISCKKCDKVCPMNINISNKDTIYNHQCIRCLECSSESNCPIDDTVILGGKFHEDK